MIFLDNPYIQVLTKRINPVMGETFDHVRLRHFFPRDIPYLGVGILGSMGPIYKFLGEGFYPRDFDKWLGLSTLNLEVITFNHYTSFGGSLNRKKAGIDVLDLLVDSYSKDDGSYNFSSTPENSRSVQHILIHNYGLVIDQDFDKTALDPAWSKIKKDPILKYFVPEIFSLIEYHDMQSLAERKNDETLLELLKRPRFNLKTATRLLKRILQYRKEAWPTETKSHRGINLSNSMVFLQKFLHYENKITLAKELCGEWCSIVDQPHVLLADNFDLILGSGEITKKQEYKKLISEKPSELMFINHKSHVNFLKQYKKYIRVLSSCLSFANCASRLTRVSKLYCKTPRFSDTIPYEVIDEEGEWTEQNKIAFATDAEFFAQNIDENRSSIPLIMEGVAGMGKTIAMHQFALKYVQEIENRLFDLTLDEINTLHLPLFLKARKFDYPGYGNVEDFESENEFYNHVTPIFVRGLTKNVLESLPEMKNHFSSEELEEFFTAWINLDHVHNSSVTLFLDGADEFDGDDDLKAFFEEYGDFLVYRKPNFIISTRPSHYESLAKEIGSNHAKLEMHKKYYSEEELAEKMPLQLCDAWGVTRESGQELSKKFGQYRSTLIHPLFVGWFCFLIESDKLDQIEAKSATPLIAQNNLISTIIDIGIESSLRRRESEVLEIMKTEDYTRLLRYFVAISFQNPKKGPELIWRQMFQDGFRDLILVELKDKTEQFGVVRDSIEDCGILYLTGDRIDWTHRTIPELIYADFMYKEPKSFILGPMKLSEPILDRLAQLEFEEEKHQRMEMAQLVVRLRHDLKSFELFLDWMLWGDKVDSRNESFEIEYNKAIVEWDGNEFSVITESRSSALEIFLGGLYIGSWNSSKPLPIRREWIRVPSNADLTEGLQKVSSCPFYTDIVQETKELWQIQPTLSKVGSGTRIIDCFTHYRACLLSDSVDSNMKFFHQKAANQQDMFDLRLTNRGLLHEDEFTDILSWFGNEEFTEDKSELIKRIKDDYVYTTYGRFFGTERYERIIEYMWNELHNVLGDPASVGYSEDYDIRARLFIDSLIHEYELHEYTDERGFPAHIIPLLDSPTVSEKAILLTPFMNEILSSDGSEIQKNRDLGEKFGIRSSIGQRKVKKVVDLIRRFQKGTQGLVGRR